MKPFKLLFYNSCIDPRISLRGKLFRLGLIYCVPLIFIFITSCASNSEVELDSSCDVTAEYLDSIYLNAGEFHNNALDDVLVYFKNNPSGAINSVEAEDVFDVIAGGLSIYATNVDFQDFYILNDVIIEPGVEFSEVSSELGFTISGKFSNATDALKEILYDTTVVNMDASMDSLYNVWIDEITNCTEKVAFTGMVSVSKASFLYWNDKASDWAELAGRWSSASNKAAKDAAWADVIGMGTGAIRGALVGLAGGTIAIPGLGTAVGGVGGLYVGMIVGAIGGSAMSGFNSFAQWAIGW